MLTRGTWVVIVVLSVLISACAPKGRPASTIMCLITSDPPGADIYWGSSPETLYHSEYKTPYGERNTCYLPLWKDWYYQLKKHGYKDSEVVFKPESYANRYVHFTLETGSVKTIACEITSDPAGADIYWGPSPHTLDNTGYKTPYKELNTRHLPIWKDWYYQVKKEGYEDSEVIFRRQSHGDRSVDFTLTPGRQDTPEIDLELRPVPAEKKQPKEQPMIMGEDTAEDTMS